MDATHGIGVKMTGSGSVKASGGKVWGIFTKGTATPHDLILRDGGAGGSPKFTFSPTNSSSVPHHLVLPIPIYFANDIYLEQSGGTNNVTCTLLVE